MDGKEKTGFGRRRFIGAAAAALFAGVAIQITGCTTDDKADPPATGEGDKTATISDNHPAPHKAVITKAQLSAGGAVTLDIQGAADHGHSLALTAEQVATIKAGTMVMLNSTVTGAHQHMIMFN
ncbi:MAG: hypothetical protein JWP91_2687 [Fibrobacteres bacterium]|nr:hypothetical protein [Fibrobacterota bacterium]